MIETYHRDSKRNAHDPCDKCKKPRIIYLTKAVKGVQDAL